MEQNRRQRRQASRGKIPGEQTPPIGGEAMGQLISGMMGNNPQGGLQNQMMDGVKRQQKYPALFGLFAELPLDDDPGWTHQELNSWLEAVDIMARRSVPMQPEQGDPAGS